jgi:hypothetical protein
VSGVALFVFMFTAWYGYKVNTTSLGSFDVPAPSQDAWNAFSVVSIYLGLTAAVAIALSVAQATRRSPAIPVSLSVVVFVLGALATVLVLFRLLDPPGVSGVPGVLASHLERTLKAGVWLGLLSAIGVTVGGYLSLRTEGIREADGPGEIEVVRTVSAGRA